MRVRASVPIMSGEVPVLRVANAIGRGLVSSPRLPALLVVSLCLAPWTSAASIVSRGAQDGPQVPAAVGTHLRWAATGWLANPGSSRGETRPGGGWLESKATSAEGLSFLGLLVPVGPPRPVLAEERHGWVLVAPPTSATSAECSLTCSAFVGSSANVGDSVSFSGSATQSSCAGPAVFDWDFGDGSLHSDQQYASHTYSAGGTYTWTMTVTADGKTCTKTGSIKVCSLACAASVPATSRVGAPVSFQGSATATACPSFNRYEWDFGDGTAKSTAQSPVHTYSAVGVYTWSLKVTNFTLTCTKTGTITIGEAVACNDCEVTVPLAGEVAKPVSVSTRLLPADCSGTIGYSFDFGDGFKPSWGTGSHAYCQAGAYTWTATVTINGAQCVKTGTIAIAIPTSLECSASNDKWGACPYEASFWAGTDHCADQASYLWELGDGAIATVASPKHTYSQQGTFQWRVTAALLGQVCTRSGTVTVSKPAAISATGVPSATWGAPPFSVSFEGSVSPASCVPSASFLWDFGDDSTSSQQNPTHLYSTEGFRTWSLTVSADGLTSRDDGPVVVSTTPPGFTWSPQLAKTTDPIVDVHFTSRDKGWTAAQRGLRGTADGGRTWSNPRSTTCYAVRFLDALTGFYTGYCGFWRTTDGGASWSGFGFTECWGFRFTDLFPTSPTQVWQADSAGNLWRWTFAPGAGYLGSNWARDHYTATGASNLRSLWFTDPDNGWAVGASGRIIRISAASSSQPTFVPQASGSAESLNGVRMLDANRGWAVGSFGSILTTSDGGASWTPVSSGTTIHLRAIDFRDATSGWAVGNGGIILATKDGGSSWAAEPSSATEDLLSVSAPPGDLVYAVGVNGTLLKRLPAVCPGISIAPATLPPAMIGQGYSAQITASGGTLPHRFGVGAGALPSGLSLAASGALSGWPSAGGHYSFVVRAVDDVFCSGEQDYSMASTASAYPLTVATSGSGVGAVTSAPTGIDCGTTCSASFAVGTDVTLTAAAAAGSGFDGWLGACSGTGTCQVTMDSAKVVAATFTRSAEPVVRLFPGVASLSGAGGTRWRSEVALFNPDTADRTARLELVPRGAATVTSSATLPIPSGQLVRVADLYAEMGAASGAGMLRLAGEALAWVRTFNDRGAGGTFGQDVPPTLPTGGYTAGADVLFPVATPANQATEFRSNLLLLNLEAAPVTFTLAAGSKSETRVVPGGTYTQIDKVGGVLQLPSGLSILKVQANGRWAGTVSSVDPVSGDPTTVRGLAPEPEAVVLFPGVASAGGAVGTQWRSEVILHNPNAAGRTALLEVIPRGASTVSKSVSLTLQALEVRRLPDLYSELGATAGAGLLRVAGEVLTWVRTYNQGATATFGQDVPPVMPAGGVEADVQVIFPISTPADAREDFRSNLIIYNHGTATLTVTVASGSVSRTADVPAAAYAQVNDVGTWLGLSAGWAGITVTGNGRWSGTVSTIDPKTGDPTTVVGIPAPSGS